MLLNATKIKGGEREEMKRQKKQTVWIMGHCPITKSEEDVDLQIDFTRTISGTDGKRRSTIGIVT